MPDPIPLFEIDHTPTDVAYVTESIERGAYWATGPFIDRFEAALAAYVGVEHAITVNSGTTALVAALVGLGVEPGDTVVVPSFTFIATANAVRLAGATPVFADIEPDTLGLDPAAVAAAVDETTVGIIPVHPYGAPCAIDAICAVAAEYDLFVLEDAAEALGATAGGRMLSAVGDAAALSFCQNKITTTGEGGAVLTDDAAVAERVALYRSHGRASADYFERPDSGRYVTLGTNIRMSDMTAALGCAQLERIDRLIADRRRVAHRYAQRLADVDGVTPHTPPPEGTHVYQLYTVLFDDADDRPVVVGALADAEIASKVYWDPPAHRTEAYGEWAQESALPVTDETAARVLSLPMHPNLTAEEVDRVVDAIATAVP